MKQVLFTVMALAALVLPVACADEDEPHTIVDLRYEVDDNYVMDWTNPAPVTFLVKSNHPWEVSGTQDWYTLMPASGGADEICTVTIACRSDNAQLDDRSDTATIRSDYWVGKRFVVTQKGNAYLKLDKLDDAPLTQYAGATKTFDVLANQQWTVAVTGGGDWLSVSAGAQGSGDGSVTLTAAENTGELPRYGEVTVYDRHGVVVHVVSIMQKGLYLIQWADDPQRKAIDFGSYQAEMRVPINADVEWEPVVGAEYPWLTVEKISQTEARVISSNLAAHTGKFSLRPKNISGAAGAEFTVTQAALTYGDPFIATEGTQDPVTGWITLTSGRFLSSFSSLRPFGGRWTVTFESITMATNDELRFHLMYPDTGMGLNSFFRPSHATQPWICQVNGGGNSGNVPLPEWSLEKTMAMRKIEVLVGGSTLPCPVTAWINGEKTLDITQTAGSGWPTGWCGGVSVVNNSGTLSVVVKSLTYEPLP
jgi:hypothetical protein